jgi:hypothetical protein
MRKVLTGHKYERYELFAAYGDPTPVVLWASSNRPLPVQACPLKATIATPCSSLPFAHIRLIQNTVSLLSGPCARNFDHVHTIVL